MASPGLPLCVLSLIFLMSAHKFKSGVSCSETQGQNVSNFDTNYHLEMVTKATPPAPAPSPLPPLPPFTHYILALQWPPSICKSVTCDKDKTVPKKFTIHGLWPSNDDGTSPKNCNPADKFDFSKVLSIAKKLDEQWPSLVRNAGGQQQFLAHEWETHGTCTGLSQYSYFNGALVKSQTPTVLSLLSRLVALGFGPDPKKTYSPSQIITKYNEKYDLKIKIKCVKKKGSSDEMIGEVHFRINKVTKAVESIVGPTTSCNKDAGVSFPDK